MGLPRPVSVKLTKHLIVKKIDLVKSLNFYIHFYIKALAYEELLKPAPLQEKNVVGSVEHTCNEPYYVTAE